MLPKGFSLVEMLAVIAIASIVMLAAVPSFTSILERNQVIAELNRIVGAVNLTRDTAVRYRSMTTLCGIKLNGKCGGSWDKKLTIFLDKNNNARLDGNDQTMSYVNSLATGSSVKWRAFQNRQYLQMTQFGYTNYQNGNFVICPPGADATRARQLVINVQGRARANHSVNAQGMPVDRKGKVLRC